MSYAPSTPIHIEVRRDLHFDFSDTPGVHTRDNPYLSHFWNALSVMAPSTERILIRVGHGVRDRVTEPRLRADLQALLAQEGLHTREHRKLNARLVELGYDIEGANAAMDAEFDAFVARAGEQAGVALMVAGEHAIYELSRALLRDAHTTDGMHPEVQRLMLWHAAEEMEHQGVAHDVYVHLYGDGPSHRRVRARAFFDAVGLLARLGGEVMRRLLAAEPARTPGQRREFLRFMTLRPGYALRVGVHSLRYFRPGFTPWGDRSDVELIGTALASI